MKSLNPLILHTALALIIASSPIASAAWQDEFLSDDERPELADFAKFAGLARVWRSMNFIGRPYELKPSPPSDAKPDATAKLDYPTPVMPLQLHAKPKVEFVYYEVRRYGHLLLAFPLEDGKASTIPCAYGLDASGANSPKLDALYEAMSREDGAAKARELARELVKVFPTDMDLWHRLSRLEEQMNDKPAATEAARMAASCAHAVYLRLDKRYDKRKATQFGVRIRAGIISVYWSTALASRYELLTGSPKPDLNAPAVPRNVAPSPVPQPSERPSAAVKLPTNWPRFDANLKGEYEVRVTNPNEFAVTVGLRSGTRGHDFTVTPNGVKSAFVPAGNYDIYFQYSSDPQGLYQGDTFKIVKNGVEIKIVKVVDGNYGIRKVK